MTTRLLIQLAIERELLRDAKCKGRPSVFFGHRSERSEARTRREALAARYCAVCPSIEPCRDWARTNGESGFWGGENEETRAAAGFPPRSVTRRSVAEAREAGAEIPRHSAA